VEERTIRALLYRFAEHAFYIGSDGEPKEWKPTRHKIRDLLEALASLVILSDELRQPCWLDHRVTGPIVAVQNGLLDITSRNLHPHTPLYFGHVSVPFPYQPEAPPPVRFLYFLDELWPQDPEAIDALGEWFGYIVGGRTNLHKILLMIGPTRSGKGAIARVLTQLVGSGNTCSPTLNSLGSEFGLAPLIGKGLAVIADARFNGRDASTVVERLLSISGEDAQTINRKYREAWTGPLGTRFHIISNELPQLPDASNALTGRFVILPTTRSWLHKEDHQLEGRFVAELPGILNWALDGLGRLVIENDNRFTRVKAAAEMVQSMRDLASPVAAFVRDRCTLRGDAQIEVDALYAAYKEWCAEGEFPKSSKAVFGRNLLAACPTVRKTRPRQPGSRAYTYQGIELAKDGDEPGLDLGS
jgi:putative DNA primase/helicase